MFIFTLILLIVFVIVVLDKIGSMKREINAQRILIFSLRDQISKLSQTTEDLIQNLEKVDKAVVFEDVEEVQKEAVVFEKEEDVPISEVIPEKVVAFSETNDAVSVEVSVPVVAVEEEMTIVANENEAKEMALNAIESEPDEWVEQKPLISFDGDQPRKKSLFGFNSENWMGVNLLNRLGALLIVIGAIATAAFDGFPSWVRSLILFTFAASVIVLGEVMNRKKRTTASIGITAVGVALMYVAVAASFFVLGTLGMYSALIACILATILGIYLAIRYDEQVIACFALVGGYLPIFALDPFNATLTIGLVVYFVFLSAYSLSLALSKKWAISNFIGLFLTIAGTSYLGFQASPSIALLYACFAFMVYTVLPLVSAYKGDKTFTEMDTWLVIINAFISSIVIFLIANRFAVPHIHTYLSAIFALVYLLLALLIKHVFQHKSMAILFLLKAVAFAVLFVPFTFDYHWFAVAWLIEAVVLVSYGILRKKRLAEYSGLAILGIAIISFFASSVETLGAQFTLDYSFFSIGILVILGLYIKEKRQWGGYEQIFKWVTLTNFWLYSTYMLATYIHQPRNGYTLLFMVLVMLALAVGYVKLKWLADVGTAIIANVIHGVGLFMLWGSNLFFVDYNWRHNESQFVIFIANLVMAFVLTALVVYYQKKKQNNAWVVAYKNINLVNLWLMVIFVALEVLSTSGFLGDEYISGVIVILTLGMCVVYTKVKLLTDRPLHVIVNVMHGLSMLILWVSNFEFASWGVSLNRGGLIVNLVLTLIAFGMVIYYKITEEDSKRITIYKNVMLVNVWLSMLYILNALMGAFEGSHLVLISMTFILALAIARIPLLVDRGVKVILIVMQMICLLWLAIFNLSLYESMFAMLSLNALTQLLALVSLNALTKYLRNKEGQETPFKVLVLSGYFLLVLTQGIMIQGQVAFNSAIISVLFGVTALAWIVLGFYLKNVQVRKFGLYLAMLSAVKLLVVDTWGLSTPMRIGSYLTLGVVLMIISFVYQKFNIAEDDK